MSPTDTLMAEHRVIEQVLDCLEQMVNRCETTGALDVNDASLALDFFCVFADQCHHGKEEAQLFPMMEAKGFSPTVGPTAVMRGEHELGRLCIQGMRAALDSIERGELSRRTVFVRHARAYLDMLRQHIQKEDHCLFPMARQAFSPAELNSLADAFERIEHDDMPPHAHEDYLRLADRLAEKYGVPRSAPVGNLAHACCGHAH